MPSGNKSKKKNKLFTTLASIEQTDKQASQRRQKTITNSYAQSLAASNQCKINSILLELRILTQRCLSEAEGLAVHDNNDDNDNNGSGNVEEGRVQEEVDVLLENLLVARRELIGKDQLNDEGSGKKSNDNIDYAKLIQQQNAKSNVDVSSDSSSSSDDNDDDESSHNNISGGIKSNNLLTTQIQNEYSSLRKQWKTILNKHHSNLALHSGMSVNTSKFQSKAVDISFWEQVQGGIEHEMFKQRTTANSSGGNNSGSQTLHDSKEEEDDEDDKVGQSLQYDDSKLYQQLFVI